VKATNGMRTDTWKMDMPIQAYVAMFAIGKFSVIKDHWRKKEVNYYVEPEYAPYASLMFKNTPEMMEYFSLRTGVPFPWNKYSQVVVHDYVSGAMENTSAALFGEFMNQDARALGDHNYEDVVSHELFHEWFGDYVTTESWSNLTVNESFANYGEQLWRAHKYGKAAGDELAWDDLQIYIGRTDVNDPQLVRFNYDSREEMFDHISYNKGGAVLRYLNNLVGNEAFDRAMYLYLTKNALHSAEAHNWRLAVEEATGQDWNWFFNEWYYHAGHPVLKVAYYYNDTLQKLTVTVNQAQGDSPFLYHLPLKAALVYGNDKSILDWNITKRRDTFIYAYKNGQRPLIIPDYEHVLPGELKDGKKPAQWLEQFLHCDDYTGKRLALNAAGRLQSDSVSQVIIEVALADRLASIRKQALNILKNSSNDKYHKRYTAKVVDIAKHDSVGPVRAEAFSVLGEWKVSAEKETMLSVLYDSSYAVAGAALDGINKLDKDTAYILAKQLLHTHPKAALENSVWAIIGKKGNDDDIALFEEYAPHFFNTKKFTITAALSAYLKNVKSDTSFSKGVDIYVAFVVTEDMKQIRTYISGFLFQVATDTKDNVKSDKKEEAETAKKRMDILKTALQKVTDGEKDAELIKEHKKSMTKIFE
jgi:aminopeptidase N